MELSRILIAEARDYQQIELREIDGQRRLEIAIGNYEAAAIEWRLNNVQTIRPQTHELLANVIDAMGGKLIRIIVNDLRNQTYYASLIIEQNGHEIVIDSRPSDAIALGIAFHIPIFVAEHVLDAPDMPI